jgi:hypothetical protein
MGGDIGCVSSPEREEGTMFVFEIPLLYYREINEVPNQINTNGVFNSSPVRL